MIHRYDYSGTIRYVHDRHGETGRERFAVTSFVGGERTIRAQCEMDDLDLLRDVTFTVGPDFEPRDAFNRLTIGGDFVGSSWFRFDGCEVECQSLVSDMGRITQQVRLGAPTPIFACHPLYVDGWHAAAFDHRADISIQTFDHCTNSSMKLDGSTAPLLGVVRKSIEYVGEEVLTVPAGTFLARHYRIIPLRPQLPEWTACPLDFWVHGSENVFLKLRWALIESTYELTSIDAPAAVAERFETLEQPV